MLHSGEGSAVSNLGIRWSESVPRHLCRTDGAPRGGASNKVKATQTHVQPSNFSGTGHGHGTHWLLQLGSGCTPQLFIDLLPIMEKKRLKQKVGLTREDRLKRIYGPKSQPQCPNAPPPHWRKHVPKKWAAVHWRGGHCARWALWIAAHLLKDKVPFRPSQLNVFDKCDEPAKQNGKTETIHNTFNLRKITDRAFLIHILTHHKYYYPDLSKFGLISCSLTLHSCVLAISPEKKSPF